MAAKSPLILTLPDIQHTLKTIDLLPLIEQGFVAYSTGHAVVPPVGELLFTDPPGEAHIKYGYIHHQPYFLVKVAAGFYQNPELGIPSSQGVMLLFSQQTGELQAILLDEGHLTDIRTVIASMITLKYLAPSTIDCVGIIGTGIQARLQLDYLHTVCRCQRVLVWGRNSRSSEAFKAAFDHSPLQIGIASSISELAAACQVIITTTPSTVPLLLEVKKGTHITAIGSDTGNKIELSPRLLQQADLVVVDSLAQSQTRGEVFQARQQMVLDETKLVELGALIEKPELGRQNDQQITVADLTGIAVQDIMIATAILNQKTNLRP